MIDIQDNRSIHYSCVEGEKECIRKILSKIDVPIEEVYQQKHGSNLLRGEKVFNTTRNKNIMYADNEIDGSTVLANREIMPPVCDSDNYICLLLDGARNDLLRLRLLIEGGGKLVSHQEFGEKINDKINRIMDIQTKNRKNNIIPEKDFHELNLDCDGVLLYKNPAQINKIICLITNVINEIRDRRNNTLMDALNVLVVTTIKK